MAFDDRDGTLLGVLRAFARTSRETTHTFKVGKITKYDSAKQRASVQLLQSARYRDADGVIKTEAYPELAGLPVHFPRFGGFVVIGQPAVDDGCIVLFSDRSIDKWQNTGDGTDDPIDRYHDLTDAIVLCGIWPDTAPVQVGVAGALVIGSETATGSRMWFNGTTVNVGDPNPASFVALAVGVLARLQAIETAHNTSLYPTALGPSGVATIPVAPTSVLSDIASTTLKAK